MKQQMLHTPEGVRDIYSLEYGKKAVLEEKLQKVLWDENTRINTLRKTQADNRFAKKSPKYAARKRKQERRERAKQDWDIAQQVRYDIFNLCRKK